MEVSLSLTIEGAGSAFEEAPTVEISRILRELAGRIDYLAVDGYTANLMEIYDVNGNHVGTLHLEMDNEEEDNEY